MKDFVKLALALAAGAAAGFGAARSTVEPERPAFLVVLGKVKDREAFAAGYTAKLPPVYAQYGGSYLVAGRNFEILEGDGDFEAMVISRWPSMEAGRAFWNSPEYAPLREARIANAWGEFDVYLVEGLPPRD